MQAQPRVVLYLELGFLALVITLAVSIPLTTSDWHLQARLFPVVVAVPLLILGMLQLGITLRNRDSRRASLEAQELGLWNSSARRQTLRLALWMAVFIVCLLLLSFPLGLPAAIFLYLRLESREGWLRCLLLAGITFGYMYFVFDRGLHLPWPEGLLTRYFQ